jgi:hypothetical protein
MNQTPEELKAKELFDRALKRVGTNCKHDSYCDDPSCHHKGYGLVCKVDWQAIKEISTDVVDEIIEENALFSYKISPLIAARKKFWLSVKKSLKKELNEEFSNHTGNNKII